MTFTLQKISNNDYTVYIDQDKFCTSFRVEVVKHIDECRAYTINAHTYPTFEKARRRYNYLVKKYIYGMN